MTKYVNAIIKIPLEIVKGEISESYSDCATFSFEWIDEIPQKQNFSQSEIIKQLYCFLKNKQYIPNIDATNDPVSAPVPRVQPSETIEDESDNDSNSTISYIEESDDDNDEVVIDSIGQIEDVTEEPVKMESLMDIMNIFIKREDLTTRKKPKNSSFKKRSKRKSHRAYTAKNYDDTEEDIPVEQVL